MHLNLRQTVLGSVALLCVLGPLLGAVAITKLIFARTDVQSSLSELASKPMPDDIMALSDRHLAAIDLTLVLGCCAVTAALMIGLAIGYFVDRSMLRPIQLLTSAMERMRIGESPIAVVEIGSPERSSSRCLSSDPEAAANRTGRVTSAFTSIVSTAIVKFEASAGPTELLANVAGWDLPSRFSIPTAHSGTR